MNNRMKNYGQNGMEVKVMINDIYPEIVLNGSELLKLEIRQPGARVMCTTGTLWLTQPGDPHDHLLMAGQSFSINQQGTILVQGLPRGNTLIQPPSSIDLTAGSSPPQSVKIQVNPLEAGYKIPS